jgi:hypothetical protein
MGGREPARRTGDRRFEYGEIPGLAVQASGGLRDEMGRIAGRRSKSDAVARLLIHLVPARLRSVPVESVDAFDANGRNLLERNRLDRALAVSG